MEKLRKLFLFLMYGILLWMREMSENIKITVQNRRYNLDIVRCYACVMVVLIHVVAIDWYIDPNLDK